MSPPRDRSSRRPGVSRGRPGLRAASADARADRRQHALRRRSARRASTTTVRANTPACSRTACSSNGSTNGYHRAQHPMQQRVVDDADARGCGSTPRISTQAVDGCGLPTFAMPLDAVAEGCARFAAAVADGDRRAGGDLQRDDRASGIRGRHRSSRHRLDARRRHARCSRRSAPKASTARGIPSMRWASPSRSKTVTSAPPSRRCWPVLRHDRRDRRRRTRSPAPGTRARSCSTPATKSSAASAPPRNLNAFCAICGPA